MRTQAPEVKMIVRFAFLAVIVLQGPPNPSSVLAVTTVLLVRIQRNMFLLVRSSGRVASQGWRTSHLSRRRVNDVELVTQG